MQDLNLGTTFTIAVKVKTIRLYGTQIIILIFNNTTDYY